MNGDEVAGGRDSKSADLGIDVTNENGAGVCISQVDLLIVCTKLFYRALCLLVMVRDDTELIPYLSVLPFQIGIFDPFLVFKTEIFSPTVSYEVSKKSGYMLTKH